MNAFIAAQTIRACVIGIVRAERNDESPLAYAEVLRKLADELEREAGGGKHRIQQQPPTIRLLGDKE